MSEVRTPVIFKTLEAVARELGARIGAVGRRGGIYAADRRLAAGWQALGAALSAEGVLVRAPGGGWHLAPLSTWPRPSFVPAVKLLRVAALADLTGETSSPTSAPAAVVDAVQVQPVQPVQVPPAIETSASADASSASAAAPAIETPIHRLQQVQRGGRREWVALGSLTDEQRAEDDTTLPILTHGYATPGALEAAIKRGDAFLTSSPPAAETTGQAIECSTSSPTPAAAEATETPADTSSPTTAPPARTCCCSGAAHHPTDCDLGLAQTVEGRTELRRQIMGLRESERQGLTTPQIASAEIVRLQALLSPPPTPPAGPAEAHTAGASSIETPPPAPDGGAAEAPGAVEARGPVPQIAAAADLMTPARFCPALAARRVRTLQPIPPAERPAPILPPLPHPAMPPRPFLQPTPPPRPAARSEAPRLEGAIKLLEVPGVVPVVGADDQPVMHTIFATWHPLQPRPRYLIAQNGDGSKTPDGGEYRTLTAALRTLQQRLTAPVVTWAPGLSTEAHETPDGPRCAAHCRALGVVPGQHTPGVVCAACEDEARRRAVAAAPHSTWRAHHAGLTLQGAVVLAGADGRPVVREYVRRGRRRWIRDWGRDELIAAVPVASAESARRWLTGKARIVADLPFDTAVRLEKMIGDRRIKAVADGRRPLPRAAILTSYVMRSLQRELDRRQADDAAEGGALDLAELEGDGDQDSLACVVAELAAEVMAERRGARSRLEVSHARA